MPLACSQCIGQPCHQRLALIDCRPCILYMQNTYLSYMHTCLHICQQRLSFTARKKKAAAKQLASDAWALYGPCPHPAHGMSKKDMTPCERKPTACRQTVRVRTKVKSLRSLQKHQNKLYLCERSVIKSHIQEMQIRRCCSCQEARDSMRANKS